MFRLLMVLVLTGCTSFVINVDGVAKKDPIDAAAAVAVSIQTTDPTNIMGSQNVHSADKAARGNSSSANDATDQKAEATPTVVVPIDVPINPR